MLIGLLFRKDIKKLDDVALVALIKQKDNRAFGEIFERYSFLVMGLCLKYLKDHMKSEDLMMHVFEHLPEKIQRNEITNFKSWLYSVAKNECLMQLRKKNISLTDTEKIILSQEDDSEETLKLALLTEEKLVLLESAINELKDEHKVCLTHFYLERKSYDEVARVTGYELNQVKSHIQNGKRNLKLILEKQREFRA